MTLKESQLYHDPNKGIPLALFACLSNSIMATTAKLATQVFPFMLVVFARFGISLLLTLLAIPFLIPKTPIKKLLRVNSWSISLVRILSSIFCLSAYYFSLQKIPLSTAVVLVMSSPLFIPVVTRIWKKTPIKLVLWWPLFIGFIGVILIVGPEFKNARLGLFTGLLSGIFAAIAYVAGRQQIKLEKPFRISFWMYLFGSIVSLPFALNHFSSHLSLFKAHWLLLTLVAAFGLLYQLLLIYALKFTRARFIGSFLYFTIIFALISDWYFFHMTPSKLNYLGVLLVILGGILMAFFDSPKQKLR